MKTLLPILSVAGLATVFVPAVLYAFGSLDKNTMTTLMLIGTLTWFITVPFWMGKQTRNDPDHS